MNELNYTTLEASQRLVAAGIVLETDFYWFAYNDNTLRSLRDAGKAIPQPYLITKESVGNCNTRTSYVPAPSMSELWRELPDEAYCQMRPSRKTVVGVRIQVPAGMIEDDQYINENPCDALADLLIWVRGKSRLEYRMKGRAKITDEDVLAAPNDRVEGMMDKVQRPHP